MSFNGAQVLKTCNWFYQLFLLTLNICNQPFSLLKTTFFSEVQEQCFDIHSEYAFPLNRCEVNVSSSNPVPMQYKITLKVIPFFGKELVFFNDQIFSSGRPRPSIINFDHRIFHGSPYNITVHYPYTYGIKVVGWLHEPSTGEIQSWPAIFFSPICFNPEVLSSKISKFRRR